ELVAANPRSVDERIMLASSQTALGRVLTTSPGAYDQVVAALTKGIDLREAITREHPERIDQIHQLASDLFGLAAFHRLAGQPDPALQSGQRALELFERLDRQFPETALYQTGLYLTSDVMSHLRNQKGEPAGALESAEKTRSVLERLVALH